MTEEEKALFNAVITLARYCKNKKECSECVFFDDEGCGVGTTPCTFKVPAAICDKKE